MQLRWERALLLPLQRLNGAAACARSARIAQYSLYTSRHLGALRCRLGRSTSGLPTSTSNPASSSTVRLSTAASTCLFARDFIGRFTGVCCCTDVLSSDLVRLYRPFSQIFDIVNIRFVLRSIFRDVAENNVNGHARLLTNDELIPREASTLVL